MFNVQELIGTLMQGGMTRSGGNRIEHALGQGGLGQRGGMLEQLLGGAGGSSGGGMLGGIADMAKSMLGDTSRSVKSGNPAAIGGLGALAGALLGGGGGSIKGALGGGAMALLGSLALDALRGSKQQSVADSVPSYRQPESLPVELRAPTNETEARELEEIGLLVLKAMINAAKADGRIDDEEIRRILGKLEQAGADAEAQEFVRAEMGRPQDLEELVRAVPNQKVAVEIYAASLLAIEVDTPAERDYLETLARKLGLEREVTQRLHAALGVA
jgi:uncharacterized membrane protein YebE (DUF533 family)